MDDIFHSPLLPETFGIWRGVGSDETLVRALCLHSDNKGKELKCAQYQTVYFPYINLTSLISFATIRIILDRYCHLWYTQFLCFCGWLQWSDSTTASHHVRSGNWDVHTPISQW